jgi:hypothetical protein
MDCMRGNGPGILDTSMRVALVTALLFASCGRSDLLEHGSKVGTTKTPPVAGDAGAKLSDAALPEQLSPLEGDWIFDNDRASGIFPTAMSKLQVSFHGDSWEYYSPLRSWNGVSELELHRGTWTYKDSIHTFTLPSVEAYGQSCGQLQRFSPRPQSLSPQVVHTTMLEPGGLVHAVGSW